MDLSLSFYFVPLISISVFVLVHYCFDDRSFVQFSSVTQSCPTLCDPMNHSTPGLPVHQQLLESTQIHVHLVSDAIQPSHPLSSPSPPALNLSQHQGLFKCSFVVQSKVRKVDFGSFILPSDQIRSDQISRSVLFDSLRPHESQHARPPCPSPTPGVHSDSHPSSR